MAHLAAGRRWVVDPAGNGDAYTVRELADLDRLTQGDTIVLSPGTHELASILQAGLVIEGSGSQGRWASIIADVSQLPDASSIRHVALAGSLFVGAGSLVEDVLGLDHGEESGLYVQSGSTFVADCDVAVWCNTHLGDPITLTAINSRIPSIRGSHFEAEIWLYDSEVKTIDISLDPDDYCHLRASRLFGDVSVRLRGNPVGESSTATARFANSRLASLEMDGATVSLLYCHVSNDVGSWAKLLNSSKLLYGGPTRAYGDHAPISPEGVQFDESSAIVRLRAREV